MTKGEGMEEVLDVLDAAEPCDRSWRVQPIDRRYITKHYESDALNHFRETVNIWSCADASLRQAINAHQARRIEYLHDREFYRNALQTYWYVRSTSAVVADAAKKYRQSKREVKGLFLDYLYKNAWHKTAFESFISELKTVMDEVYSLSPWDDPLRSCCELYMDYYKDAKRFIPRIGK